MKILFINAIDVSRQTEVRYPPLGIGYLISYLRMRYPEDVIECVIVDSEIEKAIDSFSPDIVSISAVTQNYNKAIKYAGLARSRGLPVLCGGVHISMLPESLSPDMDVGILGEGEETVCELYALLRDFGGLPRERLAEIKGITYRGDDGAIARTEDRELIGALDDIPFPDRTLFPIRNETYIFTSRGCPYACIFCASSRFWKKTRFFSAAYVVREIEYLYSTYGVNRINIYDDLFPADVSRVRKIVELLEEKRLSGKIEFIGAIRANLVNDDSAAILKRMGFSSIGIGLESGCPATIAYLKGESVGLADNERAISVLRKYGIKIYGSFIIGSPFETRDEIMQTYKFIKKSSLALFAVYLLMPYPGTPIWDYARSRGLVDEHMDWDRLKIEFERPRGSPVIVSEKLSGDELYGLLEMFGRYRDWLAFKERIAQAFRIVPRAWRFIIKKCGL